ncbi:hypothetical protein AWB67_06806 [Caballeronia terrestris]|jgi:hypothetical protein|uniref:CsbD family protein n=1 Tax=Caballeronia terrestris TaxID=1226301 RepID=A0A158KUU8_9BURK|nr:hypothetical protein AWB67_06806 [Caballeronia terrestris]
MNEDQVKGVGEKVKGKINEGVGKVTNTTSPYLCRVYWRALQADGPQSEIQSG